MSDKLGFKKRLQRVIVALGELSDEVSTLTAHSDALASVQQQHLRSVGMQEIYLNGKYIVHTGFYFSSAQWLSANEEASGFEMTVINGAQERVLKANHVRFTVSSEGTPRIIMWDDDIEPPLNI